MWDALRGGDDVAAWRGRAPQAPEGHGFQWDWALIEVSGHLLLGEGQAAIARVEEERVPNPLQRAEQECVRAEAALLDGRTAEARGRFEEAIAACETPPIDAVLGRLHARVLLQELTVEAALEEARQLGVLTADRRVPVGYADGVGAFWHRPDAFEDTLRGAWWPGISRGPR